MSTVPDYGELIRRTWNLNRVHVSPEMEAAFAEVNAFYQGSELLSYPSGLRCGALGSWVVPDKWIVHCGELRTTSGDLICSFEETPLRLFTYCSSFSGTVSREELLQHVMTNPGVPDEVPFHFRYQYRPHERDWGFCLRHNELEQLTDEHYEVRIETELVPDAMTQLEYGKQGQVEQRYLLLGHFDHPGMCNDGLVGCIAANEVIRRLQEVDTYYSYAALNTVEIVGSVAYCDQERERVEATRGALFVAGPGIAAPLRYQQSSRPESCIFDQAMQHLLNLHYPDTDVGPFRSIWGNDEVAFETPGIDVQCGLITRGPFPQYHTSGDNFDAIDFSALEETIELVLDAIQIIDTNLEVRPLFRGLPSFASPDIDLYFDPARISQLPTEPTIEEGLLQGVRARDITWIKNNPGCLNRMMSLIPPALANPHRQTTILSLATAAGVPFSFASNYIQAMADRGLVSLHRDDD